MILAAMILAVALAPNGPPPADLVHPTEMEAYAAWRTAVERARANREFLPGCQTATSLGGHSVGSVADLGHFAPADQFEGPAWKEVYVAGGCADTARHNMLVLRYKTGGWRATALIPGETLLGPEVTSTASKAAFQVAQKNSKLNCSQDEMLKTYRILDTKIISEDHPFAENGAWVENWTLSLCGQQRPLEMDFTHSTSQSQLNISPKPLWDTGAANGAAPQ
ncbi:MAG: hypothetical protein WA840_14785 [Caulobacteraceae bacterium]